MSGTGQGSRSPEPPSDPVIIPLRGPVNPAYTRPEFTTTLDNDQQILISEASMVAPYNPTELLALPPASTQPNYTREDIEAQVAPRASFIVTYFGDTLAADIAPGNGVCADTFGSCGLRTAIMETNALPGLDTIIIPEGEVNLAASGRDEDGAVTGDLDITDDLVIQGAGANKTIIDINAIDRGFHIFGTTSNVAVVDLIDLSITKGDSSINSGDQSGGGVLVGCAGDVLLRRASVFLNKASFGGGIKAGVCTTGNSNLLLYESAVFNNEAVFGGGGIKTLYDASVSIRNSTISSNTGVSNGGIYLEGGGDAQTVTIDQSTIADNTASSPGTGGVYVTVAPVTLTISNSQLVYNLDSVDGTPNQSECGGTVAFVSTGDNVYRNATNCTVTASDVVDSTPGVGIVSYNPPGKTPSNSINAESAGFDLNNEICASTDQRGVERPQSAACDSGSYEATAEDSPTPFDLVSPVNNTSFTAGTIGNFVWQRAADHVDYDFIITKDDVAILNKTVLTPAADSDGLTCEPIAGGVFAECTYILSMADAAILTPGTYEWIAYAYDDSDSIPANNAPLSFSVINAVTNTPTATFTAIGTATATVTPTATVTNTPIPGVELLPNNSFETDTDGDKVPDGWTGKLLTGDGYKCNKDAKIFAWDGLCAVRFKGSVGENSKFQISLATTSAATGDTLILSAYLQTKNAVEGGTVTIKGRYVDGVTKFKEQIQVVPGTASYAQFVADAVVLAQDVSKLKVQFGYKGASGSYLIDLISLLKQ